MRGYRHHSRCSSGEGLIILLVLAIMAMPFVGVYKLATGRSAEQKATGVTMLVIGIIIYLIVAINSI